MKTPVVSFVIVNYNGLQYLKDCVGSVRGLDYPQDRLEIIVVDNGSTDRSVDFIKETFSEVILLSNDKNNYARANNLGIGKAKGEYVAFVNNDVRLEKDWLRELMAVMRSNDSFGIAGGKLLLNDQRIQSTGLEQYPDYYWGDRGLREDDRGQFDVMEEMTGLCGAALLARRSCLDAIGDFDEDFIMYLDDVDLCLRSLEGNWKNVYVPRARAYHHFRGTSGHEWVTYYSERNRLLVLAKHYPEKLADMLWGKGYFSASSTDKGRSSIYDILPLVLVKLLAGHDGLFVNKLLPDLFMALKKIVKLDMSIVSTREEEARLLNSQLNARVAQLSQMTQEKEALLSEKGSTLGFLQAQIEILNGISDDKKALLAEKTEALRELNERMETLIQAIAARDALLERKEKALGEISSQMLEKETALVRVEMQAQELMRTTGAQAALLTEKTADLQVLGRRVEELTRMTGEKDAQLTEKILAVEALNGHAQRLSEALAEKDAMLIKFITEISDKDALLARKEAAFIEIMSKATLLGQTVSQKDAQLTEQERLLAGYRDEIREQQVLLSAREASLIQFKSEISGLTQRLTEKTALLENKEVEFRKKEYDVQSLKEELERFAKFEDQVKFLVIAARGIGFDHARPVIKALKRKYPNAVFHLFGYFTPEDLEKISEDALISKVYQYQNYKKSLLVIIRFIVRLWPRRFNTALVLCSRQTGPKDAKRARILSWLSNARACRTYHID